jgi:hypothetical protein
MTAIAVRESLVDALRLDLVGPGPRCHAADRALGSADEVLPTRPSAWYLTGFLVPADADPAQKADLESNDEVDVLNDRESADDAAAPEPAAARVRYLPSSSGMSVLVPVGLTTLEATIRWGDYHYQGSSRGEEPLASGVWVRQPREEVLSLAVEHEAHEPSEYAVPRSGGLFVAVSARAVPHDESSGLPAGTRAVSMFVVNRRPPKPDELRDEAFAFQMELEVRGEVPLAPRPNTRGLRSEEYDERVADLQYRDAFEYAVGHNVATEAQLDPDGQCRAVRTCWLPTALVERVEPAEIPGVELSMDVLALLADAADGHAKLGEMPAAYRRWIEAQRAAAPREPEQRRETAQLLLQRAGTAAGRIERGIAALEQPLVLEAFCLANRAMAATARRRQGVMQGREPASVRPSWRPFQLAFLLMNLPGLVDPTDADRDVVDLLFFPTGGGKTEAYLGLAAFTLVYRRLRDPSVGSAGVTVLMRYTLRLLTLDQLGRAATLICALELERQQNVEKLGKWPFEIGLWVGKKATPNVMGKKGDKSKDTARARTIAFLNDDRKPSPIPLEDCPWCGTKFKNTSFGLLPGDDSPLDLRVTCANRDCQFTRDQALPILAVDEPIYRRLPCFLIATVDKFAALPWTGEVGQFFGRVERFDPHGFYGPARPGVGRPLPTGELPPPELIIQDELHLISGPLGTMAGLYETALDELCRRRVADRSIRPKIIASTATVRRAENQIRALFNRNEVEVFPPPGPDRRTSFFAEVRPPDASPARLYLGVAAQGRSPKVVMLRVYLALLAAGQKAYDRHPVPHDTANPADAYMTLLGYFNSLRELGGARRLVEDEVNNRVAGYGARCRVGEGDGAFADREIAYEVVELTSREGTNKVAEAKRKLALSFADGEHVDVALATNMISVGLDITRLGLMVVFGQPKASAEYIQATSRVGRDPRRPGLVVTILNAHKPRDRSHFERFAFYHETFYRAVEATSVTPFSPRALDRGLAGALVGLARQGLAALTPARGATQILGQRAALGFVLKALEDRARTQGGDEEGAEKLARRVRDRANELLDEWRRIADDLQGIGGFLQYQREEGGAQRLLYEFLNPELAQQPPNFRKFRANRSLRDVEPSVNLWLRNLDNIELDNNEE